MAFYEKKENSNYVIDKGYGIIFTSTGNKDNIIELCKEAEPYKFEGYGLDNGKFVIPVIEIEPNENGDIILENMYKYSLGYYGKYNLPMEKIEKLADEKEIPFLFHCVSYDDYC